MKLTNQSESIVVFAQLGKHERCYQQPNHERCWQHTILEFAQLELSLQNRTGSFCERAETAGCKHVLQVFSMYACLARFDSMRTSYDSVKSTCCSTDGSHAAHHALGVLQDFQVIRLLWQRAAAAAGCEEANLPLDCCRLPST